MPGSGTPVSLSQEKVNARSDGSWPYSRRCLPPRAASPWPVAGSHGHPGQPKHMPISWGARRNAARRGRIGHVDDLHYLAVGGHVRTTTAARCSCRTTCRGFPSDDPDTRVRLSLWRTGSRRLRCWPSGPSWGNPQLKSARSNTSPSRCSSTRSASTRSFTPRTPTPGRRCAPECSQPSRRPRIHPDPQPASGEQRQPLLRVRVPRHEVPGEQSGHLREHPPGPCLHGLVLALVQPEPQYSGIALFPPDEVHGGTIAARAALVRLVGAALAEQRAEWIETRLYMGLYALARQGSASSLPPQTKPSLGVSRGRG